LQEKDEEITLIRNKYDDAVRNLDKLEKRWNEKLEQRKMQSSNNL
jgi:hypothetical protein